MIEFTEPQWDFITHTAAFPAMVAGYGAGKTQACCWRAIRLKKENPKQPIAYYLPTYGLITDIIIPRFSDIFERTRIPYRLNKNESYFEIEGYNRIIMRSMDSPEKIIGYESAHAICDELDTLKAEKAREVWGKIVARNRAPCNGINTAAVGTTPEGFRFVYEKWKKNPMKGSVIIKASTYSNPWLPPEYINNLREMFNPQQLEAYLNGEFVNMTAATVYSEYDRTRDHTNETIKPNDALHIGMDFNVGKMAATVHVLRDNKPHAVMEYGNVLDTPAMIALIKSRHPNHSILVYPDASGGSRKSVNASESDLSLLRQAGFSVLVNSRNPAVKDRVLSVNAMFKNNSYFINVDLCPNLVESLEKQAYDKNGEPDKTSGHDHMVDSCGYFISYRYPIVKDDVVKFKLKGL